MKGNTQRLKLLLLSGEKLTVAELDDILKTNNSPEVVRRLRNQEFTVELEWRTNPKTKTRYGVYYHPMKKKESRVSRVLEKH